MLSDCKFDFFPLNYSCFIHYISSFLFFCFNLCHSQQHSQSTYVSQSSQYRTAVRSVAIARTEHTSIGADAVVGTIDAAVFSTGIDAVAGTGFGATAANSRSRSVSSSAFGVTIAVIRGWPRLRRVANVHHV